jgi:hypothetical protein
MAFAQQRQQDGAWANKSTNTAIWRHAVWPRWSLQRNKAKRHDVADAVGNAIAADASWREAIRAEDSAKRRAQRAPAADYLLFGGGFCCVENTGWKNYGQALDIATENGTPQACCQRVEALLSFGGEEEYRYTQNK